VRTPFSCRSNSFLLLSSLRERNSSAMPEQFMPKLLSARRVTIIGFILFWFIALAGQSLCDEQQPFASLNIDIDKNGKAESRFGLFLHAPLLASQTQVLSYLLGMDVKLWDATAYNEDGDAPDDQDGPQSAERETRPAITRAKIEVYVYEGE